MPTREDMLSEQLRDRGITDERVLDAMAEVPREVFVPNRLREAAYEDSALPIGHGQTLSQPWIVAAMCEAMELEGDERVLEVGTGSGYSAAVLARLSAHVVSIELIPELATEAANRLRELAVRNVELRVGDGGVDPGPGSFDAIAVHAAAPAPPPQLLEALAPGGRLVVPVSTGRNREMLRVLRRHEGRGEGGEPLHSSSDISPSRFVPLRGEAGV
jgi:protein-L-isoaspartate(D-aspartate) O-methyltransferase